MILFTLVLLGLIGGALAINLISNMKIVGGNELGIVSGRGKKGFHTFSGGRIFIIPLFNNFSTIDLTPHTIEVIVDSAIAEGVVPLNVKATVSFAISSNEAGPGFFPWREILKISGTPPLPSSKVTSGMPSPP